MRKKYEKPKIVQVRLIPDEMMLSGCKQVGGAGGKTNKCPPVRNSCKTTNGS